MRLMLILWLMGLLPWDEQRDVDSEKDDLLDMEEEILEGGNSAEGAALRTCL
jgi:hypothetical protein